MSSRTIRNCITGETLLAEVPLTLSGAAALAASLYGSLALADILRGCRRFLEERFRIGRLSLVQHRANDTTATLYSLDRGGDGVGSPGESALLSALVSESGFWFANLANARSADLGTYFAYSPSGDQVVLEAEGARMGRATLTVDTEADNPAPPLRLVRSPARPLSLPLATSGWRSK